MGKLELTQAENVFNIVFDLGGVILRWSPEQLAARFCGSASDSALDFSRFLKSEEWHAFDQGVKSLSQPVDDLFPSIHARFPAITKEQFAQFARQLQNSFELIPEGVRLLDDVLARGHRAYVLSNFESTSFDSVHDAFHTPVFRKMAGLTISSKCRLAKPDPAIYHHVLASHGLDPARSLFIDDMERNVRASIEAGLPALHLVTHAQARDDLVARGILE